MAAQRESAPQPQRHSRHVIGAASATCGLENSLGHVGEVPQGSSYHGFLQLVDAQGCPGPITQQQQHVTRPEFEMDRYGLSLAASKAKLASRCTPTT